MISYLPTYTGRVYDQLKLFRVKLSLFFGFCVSRFCGSLQDFVPQPSKPRPTKTQKPTKKRKFSGQLHPKQLYNRSVFQFPFDWSCSKLGRRGGSTIPWRWKGPIFDITLRIVSVAAINSIEMADFAIGSSSKVAGRAQGRTVDTMKISFDMIFGRILDKLCHLWQIGTSGTRLVGIVVH